MMHAAIIRNHKAPRNSPLVSRQMERTAESYLASLLTPCEENKSYLKKLVGTLSLKAEFKLMAILEWRGEKNVISYYSITHKVVSSYVH